jgi:hypothetical protein
MSLRTLSPYTWPSPLDVAPHIIALHVVLSQSSLLRKLKLLLPLLAIEPRPVSLPVHSSAILPLLHSTSNMLYNQNFVVAGSCHTTPAITSTHQSRMLSGSRWFTGAMWGSVLSALLGGVPDSTEWCDRSVGRSVGICSNTSNPDVTPTVFKYPVRTAQ